MSQPARIIPRSVLWSALSYPPSAVRAPCAPSEVANPCSGLGPVPCPRPLLFGQVNTSQAHHVRTSNRLKAQRSSGFRHYEDRKRIDSSIMSGCRRMSLTSLRLSKRSAWSKLGATPGFGHCRVSTAAFATIPNREAVEVLQRPQELAISECVESLEPPSGLRRNQVFDLSRKDSHKHQLAG